MKMKKRLSLLLAFALMLAAVAPGVMAAERAVASTLRLDATEGTVSVSNRAGKSISVTARMKLYAGYSVATALESYGYISLDDTKAIKLDAKSEVQLKQSGQKLEVGLISGNLFFDVTAPLKESESLNIRTSTMVTGIRGTAGFVRVINEKVSEIYLFSGEVHLTSTDPLTGETVTAILKAGQRATSYVRDTAWGEEIVEIVIDEFVESDVPGYVAAAVRDDEDLQRRITEETQLSVPLIIGRADERLAEDEAAMRDRSGEIQKEQDSLDNNRLVDPLFKDDQPTGGGGGGPSTPVPPSRISGSLNNPSTTDVITALATIHDLTITGLWSMGTNEAVIIDNTRTLTIAGTLNTGTSAGNGIFNLTNQTLVVETGGSIVGDGVIVNGFVAGSAVGDYNMIKDSPDDKALVSAGGVGKIEIKSGATVDADIHQSGASEIEIYGTLNGILAVEGGEVLIGSTGVVNDFLSLVGGEITIEGTVNGTVYAEQTSIVTLQGANGKINGPDIGSTVPSVQVSNGGTFNMLGGLVINSNGEPAVSLDDNSTFNMKGGTIGSMAAGSAPVDIMGGTFIMDGGLIISLGHISTVVLSGGTFTQTGGSVEGFGSDAVVSIGAGTKYTMTAGTVKKTGADNAFKVLGTLQYDNGTIDGKIKGATDGSDFTTSGNLVGSGLGNLQPGQLEGTFDGPFTPCSIDGIDIPIYGTLVAILGFLSDNYTDATEIIINAMTLDVDIGSEGTLTIPANITIYLGTSSTFDILSGKVVLDGTIDMTGDAQLAVHNGATLTINGELLANTISSNPQVAFEKIDGITVGAGGTFNMTIGTLWSPYPSDSAGTPPYGLGSNGLNTINITGVAIDDADGYFNP